MSIELFPTRHKKNVNLEYVHCKICNAEVPEESTEQGMCKSCLKKGEIYHCSHCGKEMVYTNYAKHVRHAKRHHICPECYDHLNQVAVQQVCNECGSHFNITHGELDFFKKKGYETPKRCKACRKAGRKTSRAQREADHTVNSKEIYSNHSADTSNLGLLTSIFKQLFN